MRESNYAIYIEWPFQWGQPMLIVSDESMAPLVDEAQAIKEAKRWRVPGNTENSTRVTVYKLVTKM